MKMLCQIGVDEVGRGCWAGPVAAGAYVFTNPAESIPGLRDSKTLSARQREALEDVLMASGRFGYGEASSAEVDALGIDQANFLAMRRAITALGGIDLSACQVVIDGNKLPPLDDLGLAGVRCQIGADRTVAAMSAAAVLAKLRRDRFMEGAAVQYPGYGFERHKGYGAAAHRAALSSLGLCPLHRLSFRPMSGMVSGSPERSCV